MRIAKKLWIATAALAIPLWGGVQQPPPGPPQGPVGPWRGPQWEHRGGPPRPGMMRRWGFGPGQPMRWARPGMRGQFAMLLRNPAVRERLGVTAEQVNKIQGQASAWARTRIRNQADLRVKRMELEELLRAEKPDRALIDRKLREIQEVELAASKAAIEHRLAMREMLTPEQRQKLEEMRREFWQQRMAPGGPGPRRRQPPVPPQAPPVEP